MKVQFLALALGASAFVVSDKIGQTTRKLVKTSCKVAEEAKDRFNDVQSSMYHEALSSGFEDNHVSPYPVVDSEQHAFTIDRAVESFGKGRKRKNPHDQRDKTLYEFIAESEYFTILHDIIKGDDHAVAELNKTSANLTLFAPTDAALKKYKDHAPPVKYLRKILLYHLLPDLYPAGRVLKSKTLETLYVEEELETKQRLAVDLNLRGVTLNYYARVIYVDIFTSNGIVHAIDNLLFPPPPIYDIAEILPGTFSTFINAAWKTGLVDTLNTTSHSTIFAPSNFGFRTLGPRINAYLFSTRGTATLTKLLKYHIVPDTLFYSDDVEQSESESDDVEKSKSADESDVDAKGLIAHYEFKTLEGAKLNVDVGEWGRFKSIVFNGRRIATADIPAKNGVLQELKNGVILPYKKTLTSAVEDMTVEEFESLFEGEADGVMLFSGDEQEQEEDEDNDNEWMLELLSLF